MDDGLSVAVEISPGELADRFTIIDIKRERIIDPAKRANVLRERAMLARRLAEALPATDAAPALFAELRAVNLRLWKIEDAIRDCERLGDFGPTFIELARSVYRVNDARADVKRQINDLFGAKFTEEKSYADYRRPHPVTEAQPDAPSLEDARTHHREGRLDAAIAGYVVATGDPAVRSEAWNDLGVALRAKGHVAAAVGCYRRSLAFDPAWAGAWSNLGNALRQQGRLDDAIAALRRAAALDPDDADIAANLGAALRDAGRPREALESFAAAAERAPDNPAHAFDHGLTLLQLGRYRDGWPGYERRLERPAAARGVSDAPVWDGGPLDGRRLLVTAEQGHGDMIQFARFLPEVARRAGGHVAVECHPNLKRLFQASFPDLAVISVGESPPDHDLQIPMMSLARLLDVEIGDVASAAAYLKAPAGPPSTLPVTGKPRIGLTWAGGPHAHRRSCPFDMFLRLAEHAGATFFSLQRGAQAGELETSGAAPLVTDITGGLSDFADDARALDALDLVITVDTALCHLAGALHRPVWTLLPFAADWRYGVDDDVCVWHPTMRLFRQPRPGDWSAVIDAAGRALAVWIDDWRVRAAG